jgi:hypothetical protein
MTIVSTETVELLRLLGNIGFSRLYGLVGSCSYSEPTAGRAYKKWNLFEPRVEIKLDILHEPNSKINHSMIAATSLFCRSPTYVGSRKHTAISTVFRHLPRSYTR